MNHDIVKKDPIMNTYFGLTEKEVVFIAICAASMVGVIWYLLS